jgi:membrane protease YdiL (CAAX protease family)
MGSTTITTKLLVSALLPVVVLEWTAGGLSQQLLLPRFWLICLLRIAETAIIIGVIKHQTGSLSVIGLDRSTLFPGFKKGLVWSAGFAVTAVILSLALLAIGCDPLSMVRSPLPSGPAQRMAFFIVGGLIGPVAEEVFFRGLLFGYLRRWGFPSAVVLTTVLFAALHMGGAIPYTQIVGGMVFAIAYHTAKSLLAPIVIHCLGNLAIFSLSML